jgi:hypothetical protein
VILDAFVKHGWQHFNQDLMSMNSMSYGEIFRIEASTRGENVLYIRVNDNDDCLVDSLSWTNTSTVNVTLVDLQYSLYIDGTLQCEDALSDEHQQSTFADVTLYAPPQSTKHEHVADVQISNVYIEDTIDDSNISSLPTTPSPTALPTRVPSSSPTSKPTRPRTPKPTSPPSPKPTNVASNKPTTVPSAITEAPSEKATWNPTENHPSEDPGFSPTAEYMRGPVIRNASFTDKFISIEVSFDVDTNYGELGSNQDFDCSKLFTINTTAMFDEPNAPIGSSTSYCTWGKADRLLIYLGYNPWVDIGSELEFLPQAKGNMNAIRTAGSFEGGYLNITAPIIVGYPLGWPDEVLLSRSVTINGPSQIGPCGNASFDAFTITGTAGRHITNYNWGITPDLMSSCTVETSAARVEIPMGCIEPGDFTISVNVTNWLGMSMRDKFQFEVLRVDPPQVTVNGGNNIIIQAGEHLEVTLQVSPPSCLKADSLGGYSSAYSYEWYQYSEQELKKPYDELTFNNTSRNFGNRAKLVILSSDLIPGNFYEIKCKVNYQDNVGTLTKSLTSIGVSVFWELPISLVEGTTKYQTIGQNYTESLEEDY